MSYAKRIKLVRRMLLVALVCFIISGRYIAKAMTMDVDTSITSNTEQKTTSDSVPEMTKRTIPETAAESVNITYATSDVTGENVYVEQESEAVETSEDISTNETLKVDSDEQTASENGQNEGTIFEGYGGYTAEDISLLTRITYAEAGICGEEARQAVAATVLARSKEWGKTIEETIFAEDQFTPAIGGQIYRITKDEQVVVTDEMAAECLSAVHKAIDEGAGSYVTGMLGGEPLYFFAPEAVSEEELAARASVPAMCQIDGTAFYRERG